ncbi:MAG: PEGA domain-containing protein [Blastocatellia bacterium]
MLLNEDHQDQSETMEREVAGRAVRVKDRESHNDVNRDSTSSLGRNTSAQPRTVAETRSNIDMESEFETVGLPGGKKSRQLGTRWWLLAAGSALLLTILTMAAVYLLTKKPSTIDQLIILTVPSGAEVEIDSKDYGQSPVKLEQLAIGTYTLTITKDNYEPIVQQITISESTSPLEFKLKLLPPPEFSNLSPEDQIKLYQQQSQDAFGRGNYALGYDGTALYFADLVLERDPGNQFAQETRERIRKIEHQSAQEAITSGEVWRAKDIYELLVERYPDDRDARTALSRLENQLASRKGEVRDLVRKAEEALRAGKLIEPNRMSAYYYSQEALAIDRQNAPARAVRNEVRDRLAMRIEDTYRRGDMDSAINQIDKATRLFPDDKQLRARHRELIAAHSSETAKSVDSSNRRIDGLNKYSHGDYRDAIPDLENALINGKNTPDVISALAHSYKNIGQNEKAVYYFNQIPPSGEDIYRSAIAALGDIARERGDTATALEQYKKARQLGGSTLYSVATLDDRIERIEKKQREKAAEPIPITIRVKHLHGGLMGGSCSGALNIDSKGVRYDGTEHTYSSNLVGVGVRIAKDEMTVRFQDKSEKFKVARSEAERFSDTLSRFQQAYAPINK